VLKGIKARRSGTPPPILIDTFHHNVFSAGVASCDEYMGIANHPQSN
jgi:hypothetical protein